MEFRIADTFTDSLAIGVPPRRGASGIERVCRLLSASPHSRSYRASASKTGTTLRRWSNLPVFGGVFSFSGVAEPHGRAPTCGRQLGPL